jgi:hypothetical protein
LSKQNGEAVGKGSKANQWEGGSRKCVKGKQDSPWLVSSYGEFVRREKYRRCIHYETSCIASRSGMYDDDAHGSYMMMIPAFLAFFLVAAARSGKVGG